MSRGGVNKAILIGNLGSDPEVKYTPSGVPVANVSLATNESWTDRNGERQERTEWHRLVFWRKLAEIVGQYLRKGSKVYVEGRIETRSWDDQNGQKRYTTEIVVNDMQMLDSRGEMEGAAAGPPVPSAPPPEAGGGNSGGPGFSSGGGNRSRRRSSVLIPALAGHPSMGCAAGGAIGWPDWLAASITCG